MSEFTEEAVDKKYIDRAITLSKKVNESFQGFISKQFINYEDIDTQVFKQFNDKFKQDFSAMLFVAIKEVFAADILYSVVKYNLFDSSNSYLFELTVYYSLILLFQDKLL